jgi:hypothetical protein
MHRTELLLSLGAAVGAAAATMKCASCMPGVALHPYTATLPQQSNTYLSRLQCNRRSLDGAVTPHHCIDLHPRCHLHVYTMD